MNPLLLDFPEEFETERLTIRAPRAGDGAEMNAAIHESFEDLHRWMEWAQTMPTVEESEANCRQARLDFLARKELRMHLYLKGTSTLVGSSGLHHIDWNVPKFEIGYWMRKRFERQGYVTEAVNGITHFAFEVLHANRVEITCDGKNARSRRVAERAGFELEGVLRNEARDPGGELRDTLVFAKIRGE